MAVIYLYLSFSWDCCAGAGHLRVVVPNPYDVVVMGVWGSLSGVGLLPPRLVGARWSRCGATIAGVGRWGLCRAWCLSPLLVRVSWAWGLHLYRSRSLFVFPPQPPVGALLPSWGACWCPYPPAWDGWSGKE